MDGLLSFLGGFQVALSLDNLGFALIGCMIGMLVGVLPGVGQSTGMALLIPITYHLPADGAIIMLASIYYGAAYGGTITSVLMNVPGESESVVTTFDGYPMAQQGRGGIALGISAIGSFVGGVFATVCLALLAIPLSQVALWLGPPEYFSLLVLGLSFSAGLLSQSIVKGLLMIVLGLLLAQVGMDSQLGITRMTFGVPSLLDGIPMLALLMGFYGVSDVLLDLLKRTRGMEAEPMKVTRVLPTTADLKESAAPIARGSLLGFVLGIIPGMAIAVGTFSSYVIEKRLSRHPEKFGKGAIAGVAAPETVNNAFVNANFLPLLTLGIPSSVSLTILYGAFNIQGIAPGARMFTDHSAIVWGLIASMVVGNAILLGLSLPLVRFWLLVLKVPPAVLSAAILVLATIGVYSVRHEVTDLAFLAGFAVMGVALKRANYPLAPAILAFILGPKIETAMRQSLVLSGGDGTIFLNRPLSVGFLILAVAIVIGSASGFRRPRLRASGA